MYAASIGPPKLMISPNDYMDYAIRNIDSQ